MLVQCRCSKVAEPGHAPLQLRLAPHVGTDSGASALAFALLFLPTYIAFRLFARAVGLRARKSLLGPVDRVLGGGFGMVKGLLGATLVFLLANLATDMVYGGTQRPMMSQTKKRTQVIAGRPAIRRPQKRMLRIGKSGPRGTRKPR